MSNSSDIRHIFVVEDTNGIRSFYLEKSTYSLGRHSSSSIVLASKLISRHHGTLLRVKYSENDEQEFYWVIDGDLKGNRSTNGLFVNGKRCLSHELKSGDIVVFAGDVKASYYKTTISDETKFKNVQPLTEDNYTKVSSKEDYCKTTLQLEKEQNDLPQKILSNQLNLVPELLPHPIIEINELGEITYINEVAVFKFPDLQKDKLNHPVLEGLLTNFEIKQRNLLIREVKVGEEIYEQYAHYLSENKLIRSYLFDLTKRKHIEAALKESEERYRAVVRQISEGILLVEPETKKIIECNSAYCKMVGYSTEEILDLTLYDVIGLDRDILESYFEKISTQEIDFVVEVEHRNKQGALISVEMNVSLICYGDKEVLCFAVRDITARKRTEELLKYQATHDLLTGLYNRILFNQHLSKEINKAKKSQHLLAVMFLDLDHFKKINDTLGHDAGDQLLKTFAKRILSCLRSTDTVARWGGDEFTIILPEINHPEDVALIGERILDALRVPFNLNGNKIHIGLSMGIAIYPQDGEDGETLLKNADAVLYRAKEQGRNHYRFYNPMINSQASKLLTLENLLYQALEREEFLLNYQPRVNINNIDITGMEALIRWQHPEKGLISPGEFIPLAEETGLIVPIGEWVLYTACQQVKLWHEAGFSDLKVAVNISPRQFQQGNLVSTVEKILQETKLKANCLELEITESIIIKNVDFARKALCELAEMGVRLAIDDFGTGYSSLAYLKQFPFHTLKIDQSFVKDIKDKPEDIAIVSAIITLASGFNLQVVAEGVETEKQLELLIRLKCEEMQGYWFSPPINTEEATIFIHNNNNGNNLQKKAESYNGKNHRLVEAREF